jgi:tetraacyldisaccharide 4'-kinase
VRLALNRICPVPLPGIEAIAVTENVSEEQDLSWLRQRPLVLVSAIADADALERQLVAQGMHLVRHVRFPDHYAFGEADIAPLVRAARDASGVLCTLKDAVKLGPLWPREAAPLWYVSQTLVVERGAEVLDREIDRVLAARGATIPTVG